MSAGIWPKTTARLNFRAGPESLPALELPLGIEVDSMRISDLQIFQDRKPV